MTIEELNALTDEERRELARKKKNEYQREYQKEWNKKHPDKVKEYQTRYWIKRIARESEKGIKK